MKKLWLLLTLAMLFFFTACSDDDDVITPPGESNAEGIFVLGEGAPDKDQAFLSYSSHDYTSQTQFAYRGANGNEDLGSLGNHMSSWADSLYIVCSSSNLIQIVNANDFKSIDSIKLPAFTTPREIYIADENTAFVTGSTNGEVLKINLKTRGIEKSIKVGKNPESIVECQNKLFVANSGYGTDSTVSVIDMASLQVTKTINVGLNPNELVTDGDNVYVVSTDSYFPATGVAGVYIIDGKTEEVTGYIQMPGNPSDACLYKDGKLLVVGSEGAYLINPSTKVNEKILISKDKVVTNDAGWSNIYAIAYSEKHDKIYCGNPKDFTQNGDIVVFDNQMNEENRIPTGLTPGTIIILN